VGLIESIKAAIYKKAVQYTVTSNYGKPVWRTQNDEAYVKEAYNKIVWVYACVSLISSCASSVNWCLYRKNINGNVIEIEEHPILTMLNNKVNDYTSSKDFFDIWATYLALQGKFYAKYNSPILPTQMEFLYPHYTLPIPNLDTFVQGFEYKINGKVYIYDKNDILWSKFVDPLDAYNGLSPIKAMARTIDTENESVDWNKNTLQNSAVPPGAIQVTNPSPELSEKLRSEWIKRYAGSNNVRVPLILNAEKASYTQFGLNPLDMDFLNQRTINRTEICSGFGVPSQLVGDPQGQTYANFGEAQKAFWENTIITRYIDRITYILNHDLVARYADNLYIAPNFDNVAALNDNRAVIIENTRGLWTDGLITRAEARSALEYEYDDKKDNIYYTDIKIPKKNINTTNDDETETESESEEEDVKKKLYY
jgi:HK97 family phage portal protein